MIVRLPLAYSKNKGRKE